jgi:hypothetical protein
MFLLLLCKIHNQKGRCSASIRVPVINQSMFFAWAWLGIISCNRQLCLVLALKCDLDIEGRCLSVAYDTWSHYNEHLCQIISNRLNKKYMDCTQNIYPIKDHVKLCPVSVALTLEIRVRVLCMKHRLIFVNIFCQIFSKSIER